MWKFATRPASYIIGGLMIVLILMLAFLGLDFAFTDNDAILEDFAPEENKAWIREEDGWVDMGEGVQVRLIRKVIGPSLMSSVCMVVRTFDSVSVSCP